MLSSSQRLRTRLLQTADGCLFAISLLIAYALRARFASVGLPELEPLGQYLWMLPLVAILGPSVLTSQGFYDGPRPSARLGTLFVLLRSCVFTVVGLILFLFIVREQQARSVIILVGTIGGAFVYLRHEVTAWAETRAFARAEILRRALWVGTPVENRRLRQAMTQAERAVLDDLGDFDPATQSAREFSDLLHAQAVNVVILNLAGVDRDHASRVLLACAHEGVEVLVRPGLTALPSPHLVVDHFAGEAVFYYRAQTAPRSHLLLKQTFDYFAATLLLLLFAPVMTAIAVAIRLTSPGPAFFHQTRAGRNGRPFQMLKFRSMRVGANEQQTTLAGRNEMRGPVFKLADDPRITPLGKFLRRHSLDELPQLWNVLRGEMSLVGPRPLPVEEVRRFDDDTHRRRLSVKPGLTCLWQVSGRSDIADFTDWVRLDLNYIDNWSLWLDCKILVATIPAALFGRGAR